jgi:Transcriptional regulator, AbiEi antitoxin
VDDGKRTHCNDGSLVDDGSASIAMTAALWMTEAPASRFREACCVMAKLPIVFTLAEAERCGLSRAAVRHALARGRLIRVRKGLFADATLWQKTASDPALRHVLETRAAWLALDRRGWASHYSAAVLNGLPVPRDQPAHVTISQATRPEGRRLYRPGLRLRTAQVDPRDVGSEWSVAVLTPARTALDVARVHGFAAGLVLADAALARDQVIAADLDRIATSMVGWNSTRARLVAVHASGRRESPIESWSFAEFVKRELPLPTCNEWVIGEGQGGVRSDFLWRIYRLAGEADGQVKYADPFGQPDNTLVEEKERQLRLEEAGFVVVRWSGAEIQRDPDRVIDRILRQSRVASEIYGVPILRPDGSSLH